MTRLTPTALALAIAAVLAVGCKDASFKSSGESKARPNEGQKPSEEGEGVSGYLNDVSAIAVTAKGSAATIVAPSGSYRDLSDPSRTPPHSLACAWGIARSELAGGIGSGDAARLPGTRLATFQVADDGSFAGETQNPSSLVLVLSATGCSGDATTLAVPRNHNETIAAIVVPVNSGANETIYTLSPLQNGIGPVLVGTWSGSVTLNGDTSNRVYRFRSANGGELSGTYTVPASNDSLFNLRVVGGTDVQITQTDAANSYSATYTGTIDYDAMTIVGTWSDSSGNKGKFTITKASEN